MLSRGVTPAGVRRHGCSVRIDEAYSKWADELTRYASALVGPHDAADVVADAFAGLLAAGDERWASVIEPRTYLFRCVLSAARMRRRSSERRAVRERRVLRGSSTNGVFRLDLLAADGSVVRGIDSSFQVGFPDEQFVIEENGGLVWHRVPSLERIAGPITFDAQPDWSLATDDGIVALEGTRLRFFDIAGELLSECDIEQPGLLLAVGGGRPGVLVVTPPDPQIDAETQFSLDGTTTFYETVDGEINEVWTRTGLFEEHFELGGRAFVVHTEFVDGAAEDTVQHIVDTATGAVVVSNDLLDDGGAANGFVFAQVGDGPSDVQQVAYDLNGREMWRLAFDGTERGEVVDNGVLVALPDNVANTVDLTFYE